MTVTLPVNWICLLYVAFVLKHFLADFLFQTGWMAIGKGKTQGWLKPLVVHAGIHAAGTLILAAIFAPLLWWLAAVDFIVHAIIDRAKAATTRRLGLTEKDSAMWWLLGLDQAAHQLTHFGFMIAMVAAR